jgi:hypothetical protein
VSLLSWIYAEAKKKKEASEEVEIPEAEKQYNGVSLTRGN